jgi:hypothetical protein
MLNKKQKKGDLGQHWTPPETVAFMIDLLENRESILEPTAGSGRFLDQLIKLNFKEVKAVEVDEKIISSNYASIYDIDNFFNWQGSEYESIIGNPPYVNGKLIDEITINLIKNCKKLELPITSNLYLHVIEKCVKYHLKNMGEIVFIVPDTLMSKSSKGSRLRSWMCENGSFTHFYKTDVKWEKAAVSTCIIRWVKGEKQRKIKTEQGHKHIFHSNGMIYVLDYEPLKTFSSFFKIGVGCAPSKNFLLHKESGGVGFLSGKKIKYYDMSNINSWPRKRITSKKHKILFMAGPTRDKNPFYSTKLYVDTDQSSLHIDSFMIPNFNIEEDKLTDLAIEINNFFVRRNNDLNCRIQGRWSLGIKELRNIPIDKELFDFLCIYLQ